MHYTSAPKTGQGAVADDTDASGNDASAAWVAVTRTGIAASQTISSLSNGTAYRVRVRAANSGQSGPWAFGTGTPKSGDATLSELSGSTSTDGSDFGGTLDIGTFGSETTAYTATVENAVTHVKLTPTASYSGATVKVGKGSSLAAVTSGSASGAIPLAVGANALAVEVTAEDGAKRTYAVTVTRAAAALTARLRGTVSEHDGETPFMIELVLSESLEPGSRWPSGASFEVEGGSVEDVRMFRPYRIHVHVRPKSWKDVTVTLAGGRACDEDGAVCTADGRALSNSSTLTVSGPVRELSSDADLSALTVEAGAASSWTALDIGTFEPGTTAYAATLENAVTHVKLTPTVSNSDATVKVGKESSLAAATSGSASRAIPVEVGETDLKIEVTAEDGETKRTYTVTVTRKAAASTDATLSGLSGSTSKDGSHFGGTMDIGTFASGTTAYAATVENAITHVTLTPTVTDSNATVKVGKGSSLAAATSGSASGAIPVGVGETDLKIEVTAEDGATTKSYTVTVTRKAAASTDATLSGLSGSTSTDGSDFGQTLSIGTFASETTAYTATVASSITHVKLTPTASDSGATLKVGRGTNLTTVTSGSPSGAIPVEVGETDLQVEVTAGDGTTKTYTVTVTRPWTTLSVSSGDSKLDLSWLAPSWKVTGYDVHYTSAPRTGQDAVAASAAASGHDASAGWVAVARSGTAVSQSITGLDNDTGYRVRVRAIADDDRSGWVTGTGTPRLIDTTLSALSVSTSADGSDFSETLALSPAFDAATRAYAATVTSTVTHVRVTPTANDGNASVTVEDAAVSSGFRQRGDQAGVGRQRDCCSRHRLGRLGTGNLYGHGDAGGCRRHTGSAPGRGLDHAFRHPEPGGRGLAGHRDGDIVGGAGGGGDGSADHDPAHVRGRGPRVVDVDRGPRRLHVGDGHDVDGRGRRRGGRDVHGGAGQPARWSDRGRSVLGRGNDYRQRGATAATARAHNAADGRVRERSRPSMTARRRSRWTCASARRWVSPRTPRPTPRSP